MGTGPAPRSRFGPVPRLGLSRQTAVRIEDDLLRWAKRQPGGLSATVRRLLREAVEAMEAMEAVETTETTETTYAE